MEKSLPGIAAAVSGKGSFTGIGAGAIHIRIYDDGPNCEVAVTQDSNVLIPVSRPNSEWLGHFGAGGDR